MPVQHQSGGLMGKLGSALSAAFDNHKNDEVTLSGGGELPPIDNGIAQLVDCKFDVIKDGKEGAGNYYFYARGIVVEPREVPGFGSVEGMGTSIIEVIYDTPKKSRKTVDEHMQWILNEMRKLGINTNELPSVEENPTIMEETAELIKELRPYFRFRTWKGGKQEIIQRGNQWFTSDGKGPYASEQMLKAAFPYAGTEPRTNHDWRGAVDYVPQDDGSGTVDETQSPGPKVAAAPAPAPVNRVAAAPPAAKAPPATQKPAPAASNGHKPAATQAAQKPVPAAKPAPTATRQPQKTAAPPPPPVQDTPEPEGDLDALLTRSDEGDLEAQAELMRMAAEAGWSEDEITSAAGWQDVMNMILEPKAQDEVAPEPAEEFMPEVGHVYAYAPMDPRTRKAGKAVECEVKSVDQRLKRVSLQSLVDAKTVYKAVPFEALSPTSS